MAIACILAIAAAFGKLLNVAVAVAVALCHCQQLSGQRAGIHNYSCSIPGCFRYFANCFNEIVRDVVSFVYSPLIKRQ